MFTQRCPSGCTYDKRTLNVIRESKCLYCGHYAIVKSVRVRHASTLEQLAAWMDWLSDQVKTSIVHRVKGRSIEAYEVDKQGRETLAWVIGGGQ